MDQAQLSSRRQPGVVQEDTEAKGILSPNEIFIESNPI
jgi:hypothetical protein